MNNNGVAGFFKNLTAKENLKMFSFQYVADESKYI